jgi:dihydrolipoamide dehydrogenase
MYDLAIIGAGPAGIACAKEAIKKKLKVILLEKNIDQIGGTCLNRGCIPFKFILNLSKREKEWIDISRKKKEVIEKIKKPLIDFLTKNIEIRWGEASFLDKNTLKIEKDVIEAKNIIIATGSSPKKIMEGEKIILGEELLLQKEIPSKILIVGAGYIGIEFASFLNNLGKNVCVIEREKMILPSFDSYLSNRLRLILEKKGIKIDTNKDISQIDYSEFDMVILAVGRKPNIENLSLENINLSLDEKGWIITDEFMRTNIENIYACGDVTGKKLFAYVAEYQATIAIENIIGIRKKEEYLGLPECVFSYPQVAKIGILEEEAKKRNINFRVLKSNFLKASSSYIYEDTEGFIKVCIDQNDRIIGAGVISNYASELINFFSLAIKNKLTLKDLKSSFFIHPTISEIIPLFLKEVI